MQNHGIDLIGIRVELFGRARLLCGSHTICIEVPTSARVADIAAALANACPAFVGKVVCSDMTRLEESYVLNINGKQFVGDQDLNLDKEDSLLLFSSQAGG